MKMGNMIKISSFFKAGMADGHQCLPHYMQHRPGPWSHRVMSSGSFTIAGDKDMYQPILKEGTNENDQNRIIHRVTIYPSFLGSPELCLLLQHNN